MKIENGEELVLEGEYCWITVDSISVLIQKQDEGVSVYLYPLDGEGGECLAETWLTYAEAECNECLPDND
jgi:hypothetical protein